MLSELRGRVAANLSQLSEEEPMDQQDLTARAEWFVGYHNRALRLDPQHATAFAADVRRELAKVYEAGRADMAAELEQS